VSFERLTKGHPIAYLSNDEKEEKGKLLNQATLNVLIINEEGKRFTTYMKGQE
jgi:hypothetical protein